MAETVRCPVCGAPNPDTLERCRACNQLLKQSTSELNGFGERIASGQTPTEKKTSELEKALPAWLRHARQTDQTEDEKPEAPEEIPEIEDLAEVEEPEILFPDFSADDEKETESDDVNPLDWLAGLGGGNDAEEDDEEEAADWLVNLQGDLAPEEPEPAVDKAPSAADEPITANVPPAPLDEEDAADNEGLPNWISNLQGDSAVSTGDLPDLISADETPLDAANSFGGDDSVPDWLSRLSEEAAAETPAPAPASAPRADAASAAFGADDGLPDWMADLQGVGEVSGDNFPVLEQATPESPIAEPEPAESNSDNDLPDWMANLQGTQESASEFADDNLPNWLSSGEPVSEPESAVVTPAADSDLPNWMTNLQGTDDETSAAQDEDLPAWMSGAEPTSEDIPEPAVATPAADSDLPDWMASLQADAEPALEDDADELPAWSTGIEEEPQASPAFMGDLPIETSDDLPDWMANLGSDEAVVASLPDDIFAAESSSQESVVPFADLPAAEADDVPDWLSRMGKPTADSLSGADENAVLPAFEADGDGGAPEWLDALPAIDDLDMDVQKESAPAALSANPAFVDDSAVAGLDGTDEIFGIEMPDWLSNLRPDISTDTDGAAETASSVEDMNLSGAELPSWVQAMRPVASVVSDSSSKRGDEHVVAATGPLAGLSGILPTGAGLGPKNKPRAHAVKLRVNESQQSGAALLERILANETEAAPQRSVDTPASVPLLRWIVAALMILVLSASLLSPKQIVPSPNIAVPEIGASLNEINQISGSGTALLVFDYEAGLSAELQAAGAPLVDHLMLRGSKLALLSTTPNGSALAERFLKETQSQHQYQSGEDYLNIGYLPGGASGMLNFVLNPRAAITGQINGSSFWDYAPLAGINRITDFSVVVILTDDVEKGRAWIEQASLTLNAASTPFLMVISAQAEPVIYPYYASAQLDGLVSGLSGGATYERLQGQSGLGRKYWDAYSVGLFLAEIMIVFGAALNLMAGLRARQKIEKEEK